LDLDPDYRESADAHDWLEAVVLSNHRQVVRERSGGEDAEVELGDGDRRYRALVGERCLVECAAGLACDEDACVEVVAKAGIRLGCGEPPDQLGSLQSAAP